MTSVAIAGGGLAGLSCAKYLADAGLSVALFEGLPYLGGRASTWRDADGDWLEQGLHLFLGIYSEFKQLLREIGQDPDEILFWSDEIRFQDPQGPAATYGINPLHAPLKTMLGFMGQNDYLNPIDKLSLLPLAAPGAAPLEALRKAFDGQTVTQWWRGVHGSEHVLERFLRPFCRGIQFTDPDQFSAYNFLGWIHHVAMDLPHNLLGGYRGSREDLIFTPLQRYLEARGAAITTGVRLEGLAYAETRLSGFLLAGGQRVEADRYVAALPAWAFTPLLPPALSQDPFFAAIAELPVAPAISVQLWFDRQVTEHDGYFLVASSLTPTWQDQARRTYPYAGGSRISVIVSPADELLDWADEAIVAHVREVLGQACESIAAAAVTKSVVLKHRQHLIRPLPGAMSKRPPQATPIPNLFLAGDWTQQDFFGSQEGAVRSGKACAEALLASL